MASAPNQSWGPAAAAFGALKPSAIDFGGQFEYLWRRRSVEIQSYLVSEPPDKTAILNLFGRYLDTSSGPSRARRAWWYATQNSACDRAGRHAGAEPFRLF